MSTFTWIDHSEKQRRQILEAIDLFREKDTRDELGVAVIRDAFADLLFPGTGSLQTRARYFFLIPWMYRRFEEKGVPSQGLGSAVREFELNLIDTLAASTDADGTIGIYARKDLQRVPSSIYWSGLKTLRICLYEGSQAEYHRAFERLQIRRRSALRNDDGALVDRRAGPSWTNVPAAPSGFPAGTSLTLNATEAAFLRERIHQHDPTSLFAFLLQQPQQPTAGFVWELPAVQATPPHLTRQLEHARNFSEVMFGASILYNLGLAEMPPIRENIRAGCGEELNEWIRLMVERREAHSDWDREDFWTFVREAGAAPSTGTQLFVRAWIDLVLTSELSQLAKNTAALRMIRDREASIKGALARFGNDRAREAWRGEAGMTRIDFRWRNAEVIVNDIFAGIGASNA